MSIRQTIYDVSEPFGIGPHHLPEPVCRHVGPHRQREEIDRLASLGAKQVGAEDPLRALLHQHLECGMLLAEAARRVPRCHVLMFHRELQPLCACLGFGQTDARQRRQRKHHAGNRRVVGRRVRAFQQVRRDDAAFVAGHRSERGTSGCRAITGSVDLRIRDALQVLVDLDARRRRTHASGLEVEFVEIGHPAGSMHDEIGVDARISQRY